MSKWENTTMTQQGQDLLDALIAGAKKVNITRAVVGSGTVAATKLATQTEVTDPKQEAELGNAIISEGAVTIPVVITNTDLDTGYTAKQIGIFAQAEGEEEILFLISQSDTNGQDIPSKSEPPHGFTAEFNFTLDTGTASELAITVNSTGVLTESRARELFLLKEEAEDIGGGMSAEPVEWVKGVNINDLGPGYFYLDAKLEEGDWEVMGLPEKYGPGWQGVYLVIKGNAGYGYEAYMRDFYDDTLWYTLLEGWSDTYWTQIFTDEAPPTAEQVGALPLTSGTLTGIDLFLNGGYGRWFAGASNTSIQSLDVQKDTTKFRALMVSNHSATNIHDAVKVMDRNNGSDKTYRMYGEHNITSGTTDIGAGSALATGCIHLVYE